MSGVNLLKLIFLKIFVIYINDDYDNISDDDDLVDISITAQIEWRN